mgnify:CR=1 FL=1
MAQFKGVNNMSYAHESYASQPSKKSKNDRSLLERVGPELFLDIVARVESGYGGDDEVVALHDAEIRLTLVDSILLAEKMIEEKVYSPRPLTAPQRIEEQKAIYEISVHETVSEVEAVLKTEFTPENLKKIKREIWLGDGLILHRYLNANNVSAHEYSWYSGEVQRLIAGIKEYLWQPVQVGRSLPVDSLQQKTKRKDNNAWHVAARQAKVRALGLLDEAITNLQ